MNLQIYNFINVTLLYCIFLSETNCSLISIVPIKSADETKDERLFSNEPFETHVKKKGRVKDNFIITLNLIYRDADAHVEYP